MSTGWCPQSVLALAVYGFGFEYDKTQDIIAGRIDPPIQMFGGYNRLFDEASAHVSMVIDCEPFYFSYGGKLWLLELWKGQYGLETGCEIGLYRNDLGGSATTGAAKQRHYKSAVDDVLVMSSTLYRKGVKLFSRGPEPHWWLCGFKWGVFTANTLDLTMELEIKFKDKAMQDSFIAAAERIYYKPRLTTGYGVAFRFDHPHTPQPASRKRWGALHQANNLILVDRYNRYKAAHDISSNDPSKFTLLDGPAVRTEQLINKAKAKVSSGADAAINKLGAGQAAAKKLQKNVAHAAQQLEDAVHDEAQKVHECFSMFEKKIWHCTSRT